MLKTLLGKSFGFTSAQRPPPGAPRGAAADLLQTLIEFFPIGKRLRYYPALKKEIVLETCVVAYGVDGDFIYAADAIERDAQGRPTAFRAGPDGRKSPVVGPAPFQLLVPDTSDLEMKLDYHRRALIGRGEQFNKGNCISLIANAGRKGVATLATEVADRIVPDAGPYQRANMVLLTPKLHTLAVTDQRGKGRARVCAPVTVSLLRGKASRVCTIADMSETAVHIRMREQDGVAPALQEGADVVLDIDLGAAALRYTLKGKIIRRAPQACAIRLEGLVRDGRLATFSALDLLELKAGLLNYGA
ncbi:MAG: PilZ domain-containing protein [Rhodocyclales bacterium]|nr:PilZ domain-containing protein [Rhodocyclales bacterium]